jgi:hypothetical protein
LQAWAQVATPVHFLVHAGLLDASGCCADESVPRIPGVNVVEKVMTISFA